MKYLKTYESIDKLITIELFDFCNFFGMHKAVQKLIDLKDNSDSVGFIISDNPHEHIYKKKDNMEMREKITFDDEFNVNAGDEFSIRIGDYTFSYGFLRALNEQNEPGVTMNFYNVDIKDENVLYYIRTKKFNI